MLGTTKVTLAPPLVSAVAEPTTAPLKVSWTASPGWNPVPVTVSEAPGAACGTEKVNAAMQDELGLEDRIHDEVRAILEQYSDEMRKSGASYQEMFKKVKNELVRKYKAVL